MNITRSVVRSIFLVAFASVLSWAGQGALAYQETESASPQALGTAPSAADLTTVPEVEKAGESLLDDSLSVCKYQCAPTLARGCGDCGGCRECLIGPACLVGPSGKYWFRADYLLWWTQGPRVVPLVTTSSNPDDDGVIGAETTSVLFGGDRVNGGSRSNFRINFGWWLDCCRTVGVEFDYFTLGEPGTEFSFSSNGSGYPLYARPFYDVNPATTPHESSQLVSKPNELAGTVDGRIDEYFHSAGVNVRLNLCCHQPCCGCGCDDGCYDDCCDVGCNDGCGSELCSTRAAAYCRGARSLLNKLGPACYRVDLIAGYRHYRLNDSLQVNEAIEILNFPPYEPGDSILVSDEFRSRNEFHGGELGLVAQIYHGRWSLELLAKMAMGNNRRVVDIYGESTFIEYGGATTTVEGGLLALDTNIDRYTSNDFVVIPQFGAELGYQLTCRTRAFIGYNFLLWSNVARASEQIDRTINSSYVPLEGDTPTGIERPEFVWQGTDFWAQGMNLGLEYRF